MYYVYLITTKIKNRTISYVGYTNDVNKRLKLHNNSKGAKFTRGRKWKLIYYEEFSEKKQAIRRECYIKSNRRIRNLIKNLYK